MIGAWRDHRSREGHGTMPLPVTDRYAPAYFRDQVAKSDAKIGWEYDRLLGFAGLTLRPGARVLDLGCGAAPGLRYFAARGIAAVGVDVAPAALHQARSLLPSSRLICADLTAPLPLRDATVDLIILREVIEHLPAVVPVLAECRRLLRPGGALTLTTPNLWDARRPWLRVMGRVWSGDADPTHVSLFDPPSLARALRAAGFPHSRVATGFKPLLRLGGRRLPVRLAVPYPPLVGNGLLAVARC
jgi:SAM-dependent methyltransferase